MTSSAPAAVPSVEDVARVIAQNPPNRSWEEHKDSMRLVRDHLPTARAILDLFAPILAEKQKPTVALNHWKARALAAEAALAAERGRIADGLQAQADALWERCETKRTDPPSIDEQADAAQAFALQKAAAAIRAQGE